MTRATTRKLPRTAAARDELDMAVAQELGDRYQVERRERCGPLSCVYRARDVAAGQVVALKVLPHARRQCRASEGFEAAMAALATLDRPHIIPVRGFGRTSQLLWYAMPHIDGRSLDDVLRNGGPLEPRTCLRLVEQLAAALHYAHGRGVTHGNVKPANVMVASAGLALLSDFALARALEAGVPHDAAASRWRLALGAALVIALAAAGLIGFRLASPPPEVATIVADPPQPVAPVPPRDTAAAVVERLAPRPPVQRATPTAPRPAPRRPAVVGVGRLFVGATPWGELHIDGRVVGHTPIVALRIEAGWHQVRVVRDGFAPFEQRVHVAPGEDVRLTSIVLQPFHL